jgi:transcriptional regulator with XRE-family HTH domain
MPENNALAANIRAARARLNLKQSDVALRLGCSQRQISKWELQNADPHTSDLFRIAAALETGVEELLAGYTPPPLVPRAKPGNSLAPVDAAPPVETADPKPKRKTAGKADQKPVKRDPRARAGQRTASA